MALIKCPECGKEISDASAACIHCGYPLNKNSGILFFFMIGIIGENDSSSASTKPKSYTPTYEYNIPDYEYDVPDDGLSGGEYWCMGKGDTCQNKTYSAYDFYCSSCDPDGDNIEG